MAKFKFKIHNGEVVFPTDQERIADALGEIKDGLRKRTQGNARVWSQGFEDFQGFEHDVGLLENLERCTRGDPSWQMATAIEIAFQLGKAGATGKVGRAAYAKYEAGAEARLQGAYDGTATRQANAANWRGALPRFIEQHRSVGRGHPDWKSRRDLAAIAAPEIKKKLGWAPAEPTIADAIKKIERTRKRPN